MSVGVALVLLLAFPVVEFGYASHRDDVHQQLREAVDFAIHNPMIQIDDNIAAVWTRYTVTVGDYVADGVDAFHLVKKDGEWRIMSLVYTHNPKD